jgi:hypothetical protein
MFSLGEKALEGDRTFPAARRVLGKVRSRFHAKF